MKSLFACFLFVYLTANVCFAQDLTDQKSVANLKNIKFINPDAKTNSYSAILNDNTLLSIKYNVVQDGELNSTYLFARTPKNILFKNNDAFNKNYLLDNLHFLGESIGLSDEQINQVKEKIATLPPDKQHKNIFLNFALKNYDDFDLVFSNYDDVIVCKFFFRRLL